MLCSAKMLTLLLRSKDDLFFECKLKEKYDATIIFCFCRLHSVQKIFKFILTILSTLVMYS